MFLKELVNRKLKTAKGQSRSSVGPIVLNRVDTIKKHDWERLGLLFYRFQSIFSRSVSIAFNSFIYLFLHDSGMFKYSQLYFLSIEAVTLDISNKSQYTNSLFFYFAS